MSIHNSIDILINSKINTLVCVRLQLKSSPRVKIPNFSRQRKFWCQKFDQNFGLKSLKVFLVQSPAHLDQFRVFW